MKEASDFIKLVKYISRHPNVRPFTQKKLDAAFECALLL